MAIFNQVVPCCQECDNCICGPDERVLRAYMNGTYIIAMTPEQREWCLEEADRAGEGSYPRKDGETLTDSELAKWVLSAWTNYVRSNVL